MSPNKSGSWFAFVFTYHGDNHSLLGFYHAIELIMETGFAVAGFVALILNLALPEEIEDEEIPEITADNEDEEADREEWNRVKGNKGAGDVDGSSSRNGEGTGTVSKV